MGIKSIISRRLGKMFLGDHQYRTRQKLDLAILGLADLGWFTRSRLKVESALRNWLISRWGNWWRERFRQIGKVATLDGMDKVVIVERPSMSAYRVDLPFMALVSTLPTETEKAEWYTRKASRLLPGPEKHELLTALSEQVKTLEQLLASANRDVAHYRSNKPS
jgi:hypothetical protein